MAPPAPPAPLLTLHLHGSARAVAADGRQLALRGRAAALVALVAQAAADGGVGRERAAQWLWPDSPNPRQTLRQQLLRFRQALGRPLLEGEAALVLAAGVQLAAPAPGALLLADEDEADERFGPWLAQQRQALRQQQLEPLRAALQQAEASGDLTAALAHAQALLQHDPGDESHHAALMRVNFLRGEPAAGLAVYERLAAQLQAELGASPATATRDLAQALRRSGALQAPPSAAPSTSSALPVVLKRPPLLAGRSAERAAVRQAWAEGRAVLVEGEAGMGKSRLLAECLAADPVPALQAAARPSDSGAPYSALARLLRPLLTQGLQALRPAAQDALQRIGGTGGPGPQGTLGPGALQAAVAELLDHADVHTVVLDDLHFSDDATLELISGLATPESPRRWLLAQRPAEQTAAAQALRQGLTELQRLSVVTLRPLDADAAAALVDSLAVSGLQGPAVAQALVRHSGGNPLFLLETLKQGLVDGSLARGELPRPASVGALIEQRLQRLSEPALTLARVAAIAGVDFSIELAEAAVGQSAVQLASAWRELQDAQVLRDEALAHDLVADAALRGVPPVVARRVHAQCAAWLQAHGGEPARVAWHWRAGGQPQAAALAFGQAAERARKAARPAEEAELHTQAARAYADAGQAEDRFEALASRVSALIGAQADEAALDEARALPAQAHNDVQRVRALRVLADLLGQRGPFDEAIDIGLQGMALARRVGEQVELVRLTSLTAGNQLKTGRAQEAYSLMLPLREWVDREADDELRHIWYGYWAVLLGHTGRLREGVAGFDVAIASAQRTGALGAVSMALMNQCVVLRTMGALDRAADVSRRGLALLPPDEGNANHRLAQLMQARNDAETGRFDSAQTALDALLPQFEAMGTAFWVEATRATQARLWQHLGQHARALQALQRADASVPAWMQAGHLWVRLEVQQWLGQTVADDEVGQALALLDGDANRRTGNTVRGLRFAAPDAVLAQAPSLAQRAREQELFGVLAALNTHQARAALAVQQPAPAATAARALLQLLDEGYTPDNTYQPEAWLVVGQALQAAGDETAARTAWARGLAWVQQRALPQVPPPFIDSFLHRNPVNRQLLALPAGVSGPA